MLQEQEKEERIHESKHASTIEVILSKLSKLESEIDAIAKATEEYKKNLTTIVDKEIEMLKEKAIRLANEEAERIINQARKEAEEESNRIIAEGEDSLKAINDNIAKNMSRAVNIILDRILHL